MLFMLNEIMTPREACDRWGITQDALRMKLKRSKQDGLVSKLIDEGKLKYYKPEGKQRGEWILTIEAMNILFHKNT
ncbi:MULTISPECIES: helix-turn-helix domain-containing protein [Bacillus cereus group]|jgi:DNA-binding transcriptional ArsR family regulator|uniref:helix-turn-helix domain-containing protein n=1 Tax=Bacillus cereus group TaxID=86661 RepID=UPI001419733F|nr:MULTISPECIES: helix-turn-helix domain-containing protein [Bacillus cereus group]MDA2230953.1 helix-turn-helix domain-containing protein [Bacillus cereus group sp. Bc227]